jgi:hypothetical protein
MTIQTDKRNLHKIPKPGSERDQAMESASRIERALAAALARTDGPGAPPRLRAALDHAVFPGGARIRPKLCLAVAQACGDANPALTDAAAAAIAEVEHALQTAEAQHRIILRTIGESETDSKTIAQNSTKINGSYTFKNPHPSRYFYSPTALPMEKNELYIQSVYFLTAQVQYGITENFSAGITTSFLLSPIAITAKYSMKLDDKNHFAIGGLAGSLSWIDNESYLGLGFASYTYGTAESNITLAAGAAQIMDSDLGYVLNAGAHKRLSKHVSIMGEVWYLPEEELIIGGPFLRMYFNKTSCWDLGIVVIQDIALPAFSYTYKFNQN